jgi:hypothetical protein
MVGSGRLTRCARTLLIVALGVAPVFVLAAGAPGAGAVTGVHAVGNAADLKTYYEASDTTQIDLTANIALTVSGSTCGQFHRSTTTDLVIDGHGFSITQDHDCSDRIFRNYGPGTLTFQNVTVQGGRKFGDGGAVKSSSAVTVTSSTFTDNQALFCGKDAAASNVDAEGCEDPYGGAIRAFDDVTVTGSTFDTNHADDTGGGIAADGSVTVTDSTFTGNTAGGEDSEMFSGGLFSGGGFAALDGPANVSGTTFTANSAGCLFECMGSGGGFLTWDAATVTGSTFGVAGNPDLDNSAGCFQGCNAMGGGFYAGSTTEVTGSAFYLNGTGCLSECYGLGGGFAGGGSVNSGSAGVPWSGAAALETAPAGTVTVSQSTFDGNEAGCETVDGCWGAGGGFYATNATGVNVETSTFDANAVLYYGGAFSTGASRQITATVVNSTVTGNISGESGAIDVSDVGSSLELAYDTIVGNQIVSPEDQLAEAPTSAATKLADAAPAGARAQAPAASVVHQQEDVPVAANVTALALTSFATIVALPQGAPNCSILDSATSQGYNWTDDTSCFASPAATDDVASPNDPQLNALGAWGGPTNTMLPLTPLHGGVTSPVIDAIPAAACQTGIAAGVTTDQRGVTRPQLVGCDIGAVEVTQADYMVEAAVVTPKFTG